MSYGRRLLADGRYEEAFLHLGSTTQNSSAAVLEVLHSLRWLLPGDSLAARAGFSMEKTYPDANQSLVPDDEEKQAKVSSVLLPYLLSFRSRLSSSTAAGSFDDVSASTSTVPLSVLIDTALLQAFLTQADNGALLQFVQRPNAIDLESGVAALSASGRFAELVELYKAHGKHLEALDVLERLAKRPQELPVPPQGAAVELAKGLPAAWAAVRYLEAMDPMDFNLISTHSKWLITLDADATIELFVRLYTTSGVSPAAVLPILSSTKPELAADYLQNIIELGAEEREFHQELAILLLHNKSPASSAKLRHLILTSDYLQYDALLRLIPSKGMWDVRAALLERQGRHLDVLRIYIHHLHSLADAEAYCDRVTSKQRPLANGASAAIPADLENNPYALLIRVLQEEEKDGVYRVKECAPSDVTWSTITSVLSRKVAVDPVLALSSLLPSQLPLTSCVNFLEGAIRRKSEEKKRVSVMTNLLRGKHVGALTSLTDLQCRSVMLTSERACSICHKKRLGASAFVFLPTGSLAHYHCMKRTISSNQK